MKATVWCAGLIATVAVACSGNKLGPNGGSAGTGGNAGATAGTAGTASTAGTAGTASTAGTAGTAGGAGTSGAAGTGGAAGTSDLAGSSGTAGVTATGGRGGTSGVTGSGGRPTFDAGVGACDTTPTVGPSRRLGFGAHPLGSPLVGRIAQVADDRLTIAADDGGATVSFEWVGLPLAAEFSVGDSVTAQGPDSWGWSVVKSARTTAAMLAIDNTTSVNDRDVPGGPKLVFDRSCAVITIGQPGCGETVSVFYSVAASVLGDAGGPIVIAPGATGTVGAWRVTNVFVHSQTPAVQPPCPGTDFLSTERVSALGPP